MALIEVDVIGSSPVVDCREDADPKEVVASRKGEPPNTAVLDDEQTNIDVFLGVHWENPRPYEPAKPSAPSRLPKPAPSEG